MMRLITSILALSIAMSGFSQVESKKFQRLIDSMYSDEVERICIEDANSDIDSYIILDTRSSEEYAVSHIRDAQFIDYDSFSVEELKDIKPEQKILVYCSIGVRSEEIGKKLKDNGYENVVNLEGGIFEWKNQGKPIYSEYNTATDSVHVYSRLWGYWMKNGIKVY